MESKRIWHVWDGRAYPLLPEEEELFVKELAEKASHAKGFKKTYSQNQDRGDVTTLVNAMRCGLTLTSLLLQAPGLNVTNLFKAYRALEESRAESVKAWDDILKHKNLEVLMRNKIKAQRIMPIAVNRLVLASHQSGVGGLRDACESVQRATESVTRASLEIEEILRTDRVVNKITFGCKLYNPYEPSIWGDAFYIPSRVTTLMPVRVADLLQERSGKRVKV